MVGESPIQQGVLGRGRIRSDWRRLCSRSLFDKAVDIKQIVEVLLPVCDGIASKLVFVGPAPADQDGQEDYDRMIANWSQISDQSTLSAAEFFLHQVRRREWVKKTRTLGA